MTVLDPRAGGMPVPPRPRSLPAEAGSTVPGNVNPSLRVRALSFALLFLAAGCGAPAPSGGDAAPSTGEDGPQCPPIPTTLEEIARIEPSARMECYGGETITFDALLGPPGVQICEPGYSVTPEWLHPCATQYLTTPAGFDGPVIAAHLDPRAGRATSAHTFLR